MTEPKNKPTTLSYFYKAIGLIVVGFFVVIGLVGLVLPIIPGILFLIIAALLLAKISTRFDFILKSSSTRRAWLRRWKTMTALSGTQRLKLSFWVLARTVVNGAEAGVGFLRNAFLKKEPRSNRIF